MWSELTGFIACALIGISLGLIGAGGSILTMPVLVFLFRIPPLLATTCSLFIVGITSFLGTCIKYKEGDVETDVVLLFGLPSIIIVFLVRHLLLPLLPRDLFSIGTHVITFDWLSMVLFGMLMVLSAWFMISSRDAGELPENKRGRFSYRLLLTALSVGLVTGLLGAGGGFILIPALTLELGLKIKKAIGTSLVIIFLNCLVGFISAPALAQIEWKLLSYLSVIALIGCLSGDVLARHIRSDYLKKGFGWFVMALGLMILFQHLYER